MHEIKSALGVPWNRSTSFFCSRWPTAWVALLSVVLAAVFPFVHAHIPKYCSSQYFVLHVYLNRLSCCFTSHQVILLSSSVAIFVQDFVFLVRGLILSQKGSSSVAPFPPPFVTYLIIKELFWQEPGDFISCFSPRLFLPMTCCHPITSARGFWHWHSSIKQQDAGITTENPTESFLHSW